MKLCVPVRVPNGIESCIEPHLPNAEYILLFDTETREFEHVSLREPAGDRDAPRFDAALPIPVSYQLSPPLSEHCHWNETAP